MSKGGGFGIAEGLTELGCFTQHEGVRPELADGSVIETLITHTLLQAFSHQDERHVAPRANGTEYTDEERAEKTQRCVNDIFMCNCVHWSIKG